MRYYAIKISGGTNTATSSNTSGAALPTSSVVPGRVSGPVIRNIENNRPSLKIWDPVTGSNVITVKPQPSTGTGTGTTPSYTTPSVPSSIQPVSGALIDGAQFTSVVNGVNDPGALDIELESQLGQEGIGSCFIKIKGITPAMISQATNLNECRLQMWAGFSPGLPLANIQVPHQGLIFDGKILPAFGNWIYNELSLDMYVTLGDISGLGGPTKPKNIVHNMPAGQPLSTALQNTLKVAFPNSTIVMNISDKLKLNYPDWGIYQSLEQLGSYVKSLSFSILGTPSTTGYKGVSITQNGNTIHVNDGTTQSNIIPIRFEDLIGQPTWIENNTIQVKTCLRGDIPFPNNCWIKLPPTIITQTPQGAINRIAPDIASEYGGGVNYLLFTGQWQVTGLRHIGRFRDPSMDAWVTIINAVADKSANGSAAPGGASNTGGVQTFTPSGAAPGASGGIGRQ
jgi:hypothetical protein